jgi:hypothetical protein
LLSALIWIAIATQTWFIMRAYLDEFPYAGSLLLIAITAIGVSIPTPGGIGGFHYFLSLGLVHFFSDYMSATDPNSQAAGISNGAYIISMLPLFGLGLILLYNDGLLKTSGDENGHCVLLVSNSKKRESESRTCDETPII